MAQGAIVRKRLLAGMNPADAMNFSEEELEQLRIEFAKHQNQGAGAKDMVGMKLLVDSCVFIDAFDPQSHNHVSALRFLEELSARQIMITMPAHGWFEVQCALRRLEGEDRFAGPAIDGKMQYPVELIHIDKAFIKKYQMAGVPQLKAGDHIFAAVAKVNDWPLITSDMDMIKALKRCDVRAFEPVEFLAELAKDA